jgi:cell division protein FtsB
MLEFQEKRKFKRILYSKFTLVILIIIIGWILNAVWKVYIKQDLTKNNLVKTARDLEGLRTREKMLSSEIERLKTDGGVEEEIREKYGLVKPGEEILVVIDKEADINLSSTSTGISFWQKILDWLK